LQEFDDAIDTGKPVACKFAVVLDHHKSAIAKPLHQIAETNVQFAENDCRFYPNAETPCRKTVRPSNTGCHVPMNIRHLFDS
jgi:hypothetical protein